MAWNAGMLTRLALNAQGPGRLVLMMLSPPWPSMLRACTADASDAHAPGFECSRAWTADAHDGEQCAGLGS